MSNTLRVADVMVADIHSVDGLATVAEAVEAMRCHAVSSLVVARRHDGDEYGLVVVADIARKVIAENRPLDRTNVYEIMSKPILTLPSEMLARYAVRLLVQFDVSRGVAIDHDRNIVGMVTMRDLVLRLAEADVAEE